METLVALIGIVSLVLSVGALCLIALFVLMLPGDYFRGRKPPALPLKTRHPWVNIGIVIAKNLLGVFLLLLGFVLLALPGQGILTILVGLVLLDFPGKRGLELRLVKRPRVLAALNWIRTKLGRAPFVI